MSADHMHSQVLGAFLQHDMLAHKLAGVPRIMQAAAQRFVGLFVGLGKAVVLKFYQYVVDPAPYDSWPAQLFSWLARGPIR